MPFPDENEHMERKYFSNDSAMLEDTLNHKFTSTGTPVDAEN